MNAGEHDELRPIDELAARRNVDDFQLAIDGVPARAWLADNATVLDALYAATTPIPGRPGWRVDSDGRQWYSASWLDGPVGAC